MAGAWLLANQLGQQVCLVPVGRRPRARTPHRCDREEGQDLPRPRPHLRRTQCGWRARPLPRKPSLVRRRRFPRSRSCRLPR
eukprot:4418024-Prymnesium_polylepis.1